MKSFLASMSDLERAVFAEIYAKQFWADAMPLQALTTACKAIASMRATIESVEEMPDEETP